MQQKKPTERKSRWLLALGSTIVCFVIVLVTLVQGRHILRTQEHTRLIKQISAECADETTIVQRLGQPYAILTSEQLASFLMPFEKLPVRISAHAMIYQKEDFIYIFYLCERRKTIGWQLIRS